MIQHSVQTCLCLMELVNSKVSLKTPAPTERSSVFLSTELPPGSVHSSFQPPTPSPQPLNNQPLTSVAAFAAANANAAATAGGTYFFHFF